MGPALREDELQGRLRFLGWGEEAGGLGWPRFVSLEVGGGGAGDFGR